MADETKKYLINVQSNLDEYAAKAAEAKKELDRLRQSVDDLKASKKTEGAEWEKANADLRNAQKEYTQAKKLVDLQTTANKSNSESRKQLAAMYDLEKFRLGALSNQYEINSKGQRVLSQTYLEQVKKAKDAKDAIIAYDKAQSDGRSSVGLYTEAIDGAIGKLGALPGPLGKAGQAVQGLSTLIKTAFATNPIGIIILAIVAAVTALIAIFRKFEPIIEKIERAMAGLKAVFSGISNVIIGLVTGQKTLMESFRGLGDSIKTAYDEGVKWKQLEQDIEEQTYKNNVADAKRKTQIDELMLASRNRTKSEEERIQLIDQALLLEEIQFAERKKLADAAVKLQEDQLTAGKNFTAEEKKLLHEQGVEYALLMQLKKNITDDEIAALSESLVAQEQVNNESIALREKAQNRIDQMADKAEAKRQKEIEAAQKAKDKAEADMVKAKEKLDKELELYRNFLSDQRKADKESLDKKKEEALKQADWEKEQQMINAQNMLELSILNDEYAFSIKRRQLEIERQDAVTAAKKTGANVNLINEIYAKKQLEITKIETDAKLQMASQFAQNLATIFGEGSAMGKAAGVAAVTIETYRAAMAAYTGMIEAFPGPWGIAAGVIAAAAAVATGIANVKKIIAVKIPGKGGSSGSTPSAISASQPAQRSFAQSTGSSFVGQPQLTQSQVNALPNQNALSADDIANAVSKLPPPIVTVEDINAKTESVKKIEVMATV